MLCCAIWALPLTACTQGAQVSIDSLRRYAEIKGTTEYALEFNIEYRETLEAENRRLQHENGIIDHDRYLLRNDTTDMGVVARTKTQDAQACADELKTSERKRKWNNILRSVGEAVGVVIIGLLIIK